MGKDARILRYLRSHPGATVDRVAYDLHLNHKTVLEALIRMEQAGDVLYLGEADENDRRGAGSRPECPRTGDLPPAA